VPARESPTRTFEDELGDGVETKLRGTAGLLSSDELAQFQKGRALPETRCYGKNDR
jgi:hypothetical protein